MLSGLSSAAAAAMLICAGSLSVSAADGLAARFMAISKACEPDVANFCQGLAPGGGRVMHCLGSNYMSVSEPCRSSMTSAMNDLCSRDLATLCPGTSIGSPEAVGCLRDHVPQLTGSCKAAADRIATK